jgi:hypothetical protein
MLFYHFTHTRLLNKILEQGLRPLFESERDVSYEWEDAAPDGIVWLTASEQPPGFFDEPPEVRITIRLPKSRRLHHWLTWMRKHRPEEFAKYTAWSPDEEAPYGYWNDGPDFWFFAGPIAPDKFEAIDVESIVE